MVPLGFHVNGLRATDQHIHHTFERGQRRVLTLLSGMLMIWAGRSPDGRADLGFLKNQKGREKLRREDGKPAVTLHENASWAWLRVYRLRH